MADAKLYSTGIAYPKMDAIANAKLSMSRLDQLVLGMNTCQYRIVGRRAATTDPWEIDIAVAIEHSATIGFARPAVTIASDNLNWKAMGDLALKSHCRPSQDEVWPVAGQAFGPFVKVDATEPSGYKGLTLAELKTVLSCRAYETGDFAIDFEPGTTGYVAAVKGVIATAISNCVAHVLAQTSQTNVTVYTPEVLVDVSGKDAESYLEASYTFSEMAGTDDLTIGNYTSGPIDVAVKIPAFGANSESRHVRTVESNVAYATPSITLDQIRRASKAGVSPTMEIRLAEASNAIHVTYRYSQWYSTGANAITAAYVSVADPNAVVEIDFDQANSLDVLATAAFAGVGGLVGVGVTTELENLLANSQLSPIFSSVATALGATTAAVISGYVSALVAAYANGWITNDQLFDLSNHAMWIQNGAKTIALAATAGVAITNVNSLLTYLGVSNSTLSIAIAAVGGAATSAGVALGMASVMSKVVRHSYWGD